MLDVNFHFNQYANCASVPVALPASPLPQCEPQDPLGSRHPTSPPWATAACGVAGAPEWPAPQVPAVRVVAASPASAPVLQPGLNEGF